LRSDYLASKSSPTGAATTFNAQSAGVVVIHDLGDMPIDMSLVTPRLSKLASNGTEDPA
jgi:hypothetical protein